MENIKLRAFNPVTKNMLYSYDAPVNSLLNFFYAIALAPKCEIMQAIGMTDANGKDIYEADIIYINGERWLIEPISSLERDGMHWGLCASKDGNGTNYFIDRSILKGIILGNIHENPDLLNAR